MAIYKLNPVLKDYIWGGNYFKEYRNTELDVISESWELSFHKDGPTMIEINDKLVSIADVVTKKDLGANLDKFSFFPMLIKLIDAEDNLSIQVHPSDEYALKHENSYGKTEMWHIIDAKPGAGLYLGFKNEESCESIELALRNGSLLDKLNFFQVKKGESYFIPAGTVHAIGKGCTIIEIQQNSNLTYRLYDYNRIDNNGNKRELHIDKSIKVIGCKKPTPLNFKGNIIGQCEYFSSYKFDVNGCNEHLDDSSFTSITFLEGTGFINELPYHKFDSFFISANEKIVIKGTGTYILSKVENLQNK